MLLNKLAREAADTQNSKLPIDIREAAVDLSLPLEDIKLQYLMEIQNPYRFRYGETVIRIEYVPAGPSINELLAKYFERRR